MPEPFGRKTFEKDESTENLRRSEDYGKPMALNEPVTGPHSSKYGISRMSKIKSLILRKRSKKKPLAHSKPCAMPPSPTSNV